MEQAEIQCQKCQMLDLHHWTTNRQHKQECVTYFSKCGVLDLDPETQKPKVKLFHHKDNKFEGMMLKGDASICYAHLESVDLALQILDENPCCDRAILSKQRAK
jgi:hypothetical protein